MFGRGWMGYAGLGYAPEWLSQIDLLGSALGRGVVVTPAQPKVRIIRCASASDCAYPVVQFTDTKALRFTVPKQCGCGVRTTR